MLSKQHFKNFVKQSSKLLSINELITEMQLQ